MRIAGTQSGPECGAEVCLARRLAWLGLAGTGGLISAAVLLHLIQPDLSPVDDAVSYYMNGPFGWILSAGLIMLGLGSFSLLCAFRLVSGSLRSRVGLWFLGAWALCVAVGAIFPPDPRGHWNEPPSVSGMIHAGVAMLAFVAFPVAAFFLSGPLERLPRLNRSVGMLRILAYVSALSLLAFFVCLAPVFSHHAPNRLGLAERFVLTAYVGWLAAAGSAVIGTAGASGTRR